jgi:hypothetical protein
VSYFVVDPEQHHTRRRRLALLLGLAGIVAVLVLVAGLVIARPGAEGPDGPSVPVVPTLSWETVGDQPVPISAEHGPRERDGGVARGFSHDELGAALAAVHLSVRLSADVGPQVYEVVAREQCIGDAEATLAVIRGSRSTAPAGSTVAEAYYYKITAGDPAGDQVLVSLAISSPQARSLGGYIGVLRTLRWVDGDWKLELPPPAPQVIGSVNAYTPLGGSGV